MTRPLDRTITVLGSPSVGKSALMLRFTDNQFAAEYSPTIARSKYLIQHSRLFLLNFFLQSKLS